MGFVHMIRDVNMESLNAISNHDKTLMITSRSFVFLKLKL